MTSSGVMISRLESISFSSPYFSRYAFLGYTIWSGFRHAFLALRHGGLEEQLRDALVVAG